MSTELVKSSARASQQIAERYAVDPKTILDVLKRGAFKSARSDTDLLQMVVVANQYRLNPFTREIFAFPAKDGSIVPVVGIDGWVRIMNEHPQFDGVETEEGDGFCKCTIHRKDRAYPIIVTEYMSECKGTTFPWTSHPKRMLRHKAIIQCARIAFGFSGIMDEDEASRIQPKGVSTIEVSAQNASRLDAVLNIDRSKQEAIDVPFEPVTPDQEPETTTPEAAQESPYYEDSYFTDWAGNAKTKEDIAEVIASVDLTISQGKYPPERRQIAINAIMATARELRIDFK